MYRPLSSHTRSASAIAIPYPGGGGRAFPSLPSAAGVAAGLRAGVAAAARRAFPAVAAYGAILAVNKMMADGTLDEDDFWAASLPERRGFGWSGLDYIGRRYSLWWNDPEFAPLKGTSEDFWNTSNSGMVWSEANQSRPASGSATDMWGGPKYAGQRIDNGYYLNEGGAVKATELTHPAGTRRFARWVDVWRNMTGKSVFPVRQPLVEPWLDGVMVPPAINGRGYPLWRGRVIPAKRFGFPIPRLAEVAITITPGVGVSVTDLAPIRPWPNQSEVKGRPTSTGFAAAATAAFALYEAVDDWTDWLSIVLRAIPGIARDVLDMRPLDQLDWLARHPEALLTARWDIVAIEILGWSVDEFFGAQLGNVQTRSSRFRDGLIHMREGVNLAYDPGMGSVGSALTDLIYEHLYGQAVKERRRGQITGLVQGNIKWS